MVDHGKFDTLMSRQYQLKYEPSASPINPYFPVIEHRTRARLVDIHERNMYRRSLSELLNSQPVPTYEERGIDKGLNQIVAYEKHLKGKVSAAAPSKAHQQLAALRQGRDPRMNEPNAHFNRIINNYLKENQGFNVGRKKGMRPASSVLAWRPKQPFFTFEKAMPTKGQVQEFETKQIHAKIMNDKIMEINQKTVPEELLPRTGLAWVEPDGEITGLKRSNSEEQLPSQWKGTLRPRMKTVTQVDKARLAEHQVKVQVEALRPLEQAQDQAQGEQAPAEADANVTEAAPERKPSEVLAEMRSSNVNDIIKTMTVHEQLRMLRHIIEAEEFKKKQLRHAAIQAKGTQAEHDTQIQSAKQVPEPATPSPKKQAELACNCAKQIDEMNYHQLVEQKPAQAIAAADRVPLTKLNLNQIKKGKGASVGWKVVSTGRAESDRENDQASVNNESQSSKATSGWNVPQKMDKAEHERRLKMRENMPQVPPVPRYIMGQSPN